MHKRKRVEPRVKTLMFLMLLALVLAWCNCWGTATSILVGCAIWAANSIWGYR